jgi:hypothetical protein
MECPVAVADPKVRTPPVQDRIQLLDHDVDSPITRKRPDYFAYPVTNIAARLFARPHQQHPPPGFAELEAQKREASCQRCQPILLLINNESKSRKLRLQLIPRLPRRLFRSRQQHHIIRISDQPSITDCDTVAPAPLTIDLMQKDVGQQW